MIIGSINDNYNKQVEAADKATTDFVAVTTWNPDYDTELAKHIAYPAATGSDVEVTFDQLAEGVFLRLQSARPANLVLTGLDGWKFDDISLVALNPGGNVACRLDLDSALEGTPNTRPDGTIILESFTHEFPTPVRVKRILLESMNRAFVTFFDPSGQVGYTAGIGHLYGYEHTNLFIYNSSADFSATRIVADVYSHYVLGRAPRMSVILPNTPQNIRISGADDRVLHAVPHLLGPGEVMETPDIAATLNAAETPDFAFRITSQFESVVFIQAKATRHREAIGWSHVDADAVEDKVELTPWMPVPIRPTLPTGAGDLVHLISGKADFDGPVRAGLAEQIGTTEPARVTLSPRMKYAQPFRLAEAASETARTIEGVWLLLHDVPEAPTELHVALTAHDTDLDTPGAALAETDATLPDALDEYQPTASGHLACWIALPEPLLVDGPVLDQFIALELSAQDGPARLVEVAATVQPLFRPALSLNLSRDARWRPRSAFASPKTLLFDIGLAADPDRPGSLGLQSGSDPAQTARADAAGAFAATVAHKGDGLQLTSLRGAVIDPLDIVTRD